MLEIKYLRMPYNFNSAQVAWGDWAQVRRFIENFDLTVIWVKEGEGLHYGWVHNGKPLQYPKMYKDLNEGAELYKSDAFITNVVEVMAAPTVLL